MALQLVVTLAGRAALVNAVANGTNAVTITQMGVTTSSFVAANTLTALPDELKRVAAIAGIATGDNTMNVVVRDDSADTYAMKGFGLYLNDGTLFAATSSPTTILEKSGLVSMLITLDVAFTDVDAGMIEFGDTNFANPMASATVPGISEHATQAEAETGTDPVRVITAKVLHDVVRSKTVTGAGLATGGGALTANVVITVTEASAAETTAGAIGDKVVTPRRLKTVTDALTTYIDTQLAAARTLLQSERRGDVVFRATQTVPAGAYECDGRALNRVGADAALFAVIGTSYGPGDGATTFNIPDMRGYFPRGWDNGRGIDAGRVWGSSQADMLASHSHSIPSNDDQGTGNGFVEDAAGSGSAKSANTGAAGGVETRPKNVAGMFIIWR